MEDVIRAFAAMNDAEERWRDLKEQYRETVRAALADKVPQTEIADAIGRTRESVRQDAMTDEQRTEHRRAATERERKRRKAKTPPAP